MNCVRPRRVKRVRSVQVCGDRFIKRQSPRYSRLERRRSAIGALVGESCGLFEVPEVLSFDDANGEIVFRFVSKAIPLRTYLAKNPRPELTERCGRALGHIHLANSTVDNGDVFWHGDYAMSNLLYSEDRDRLTIVDWSNADWAGLPPELSMGPAGLDLGVAFGSLFHRMLVYGPRIASPECLGWSFLKGYALGRPGFRLAAERPFLSMIQGRRRYHYFARRGFVRTVAAVPSWVREWRFLSLAEQDLR